MKRLFLILFISLGLLIGNMQAIGVDDWDKGENRIPNSDFEVDANGAIPTGWTLEDGT
jgi:hypothetical protein